MTHIGLDLRLPYYQRGGISQYAMQLVPALAALNTKHDYTIFRLWKDSRQYLPSHSPNFGSRRLITPCHHRLERWTISTELWMHSLRKRIDIFHSPDFIPPQFGAKRRIITVHDLNFIYFPQFLTTESLRYYRDQIEWAVATADHISADSHQTRRDLIDRLKVSPSKVTTVHLAVNEIYHQAPTLAAIEKTRAQYNLPNGFILAVGTIEPRKNYEMLIDAYHLLRNSSKINIPLIIVGRRGWLDKPFFDRLETLKLQDEVRLLQGVSNEELSHLYRSAGVLVTPSHYEGFGLPGLEALTCACPIIVSDRGSLPEIAGPAGAILPPDDPAAWASEIADVLTNTDRRQQMIEQGLAHASTFSWQKAATLTNNIYDMVS